MLALRVHEAEYESPIEVALAGQGVVVNVGLLIVLVQDPSGKWSASAFPPNLNSTRFESFELTPVNSRRFGKPNRDWPAINLPENGEIARVSRISRNRGPSDGLFQSSTGNAITPRANFTRIERSSRTNDAINANAFRTLVKTRVLVCTCDGCFVAHLQRYRCRVISGKGLFIRPREARFPSTSTYTVTRTL